jgi:chromate transporter
MIQSLHSFSLTRLALIFLRIGNLTLGGGDPAMAALERELVGRRGWLAPEKYGLSYALARLTPGTNVLAFCAAVAWYLRGWRAAVAALLAVTIPSSVLAVWLTYAYQILKDNSLARGTISGMLAAAVGMMSATAWDLVRLHVSGRQFLRTLVLFAGSALLALVFSVPPIQVLALAALLGFFWRGPAQPATD